jgi:hypothetical protein
MLPAEEWKRNPLLALGVQWFEAWQCAVALSREDLERRSALFWDPQLRSRCLADLSQIMERYMSSPAFLEWMQLNLKLLTGSHSSRPPTR